ncbi:GNAT family N-acetyltransferase [Roseobacter sp. OBYS 0001]|uniref:GNAT family N-acetyltransferase n=1 Tax=Roseobacter sp. OBYS 0001 TaxID=882651 RepID=UPI001BBB3253|nr:GNAT family N-acetyltransferase [Roseobacter sp. OBYS 0001]GIT87608.1 GNAT family acetyltransferase [Roseobacter sp. OBYS 0001]
MTLEFRRLSGAALNDAIPAVAALRIAVFRDWPYLYEGDLEYEAEYLAPYAQNPLTVLIGAFEGARLVGASTAMPLTAHADGFASAFVQTDIDVSKVSYCAESVLLPQFRGHGAGHAFFDLREAAARQDGFDTCVFCSVIRPADHPLRPTDYRPLDGFWRARGYRPLPGVVATFNWKDLGAADETPKQLQFWARDL